MSHSLVASLPRRRAHLRAALGASAMILIVGGCSSLEPTRRPSASTLTAITPTEVAGTVGLEVIPSPTVVVTDAAGMPVPGQILTVDVTAGGGWVQVTRRVTDENGRVTIPWRLGTTPTVNTLTVSAGTLATVRFTATAGVGPVEYIFPYGDGQIAAPGTALPEPLRVRVQDAFDNPVPGATVTFSVIPDEGMVESTTAISDASGFATSGRWTLGPSLGTQKVWIRAGSVETVVTAESYVCSDPVPGTCANPLELAFARVSDGQIYRARFDGSELRRLTNDGENFSPAWSSDGRRLAFIRRDLTSYGADGDVWLMDADGSNLVRRTMNGRYRSVAWSPDGTRLAVSDDGVYASNVWIITADGDAAATLLRGQARSPAWSPDGRKIAFVRPSGDDGYDAVWVMNPDGSDAKPLTTPGGGIEWGIAWSPDGRSVAYTDNANVHIVNADGSGNRVVAGKIAHGVDWSPDGKRLAVMISTPNAWNPAIGYLPIQGGEPIVILRNAYGASWRP